ncbi:MAG: hypothetical protein ACKO3T_17755 [Planctomycetaceae bacterium]
MVLDHVGTRIAIRARARNRIRIHYRESLLPRMSAAIEYEYEYRPPGRTEYEYEFVFLGGACVRVEGVS